MKKWFIIAAAIVIVLGLAALDSKIYYPELPINSLSRKEVLTKINDSPKEIIKIGEEDDYEWFIAQMDTGKAYENLKRMIIGDGWQFETQEGSGFLFKKENKTLIAETQMWTGDYIIIKLPNHWDM